MNPFKQQLQLHKEQITEIFRDPARIQAITTVLSACLPHDNINLSTDQFSTVSNLAKYQGARELIQDFIKFNVDLCQE